MSKFYKFEEYLKTKAEDDFTLTFDEMEEIMGVDLPESAYFYPAYWVPSKTHSLPNLIKDCGFRIEAYPHQHYVKFHKRRDYIANDFIEKKESKTRIRKSKIDNYKVDISKYVNKFMHIYNIDSNSRYKSYDHIRRIFIKYRKDESKRDLLTLHLYAYLASWGMLRNSFLMQKDYLFSRPIIDLLCSDKYDSLMNFDPFGEVSDNDINLIIELSSSIVLKYIGKAYYGEGETGLQRINNVSDTLVSKILLGTFGCTVAYDRYVRLGLSSLNLTQKISKESIKELCNFAKANEEEIKTEIKKINELYTPMKIIDMYFFEKGYELEKNSKTKSQNDN